LRIWRFHRSVYDPLDTTGAYLVGGRWNPRGVSVLYGSETFAGGLLELLAHSTDPRRPPRDHVASLIEIPDDAGIAMLEPPYPRRWNHPDDYTVSVRLARPWLETGEDLALRVPSVPGAPVEHNIVVNARHPGFGRLRVIETVGPIYDQRVWG
jgi:RES domain-containing protein